MDNKNQEKLQSQLKKAYERFVPCDFIRLLGKEDITQVKLGDQVERTMTILFSDIRDFTTLSEEMSPQENFNFINSYLSQMEPVISSHEGMIDKFIGDAIMALFPRRADDALSASIAMLEKLDSYNSYRKKSGYKSIRIGIGINSGHLMLGTIGGMNHMEGTVISDTVNLASRIEGMTKQYGVSLIVSEHTLHSLRNAGDYCIRYLDRVMVKGKTQPQSVYEVFDNDDDFIRDAKIKTKKLYEEALACYHLKKIEDAENLLKRCLDLCPEDIPARMYSDRCRRFIESGVHEGTGEIDKNIVWDKRMEVGIEKIDRQHQDLFHHTNILMNAIREKREGNELEDVISFLNEYVARHFRDEQKIMEEYNYPFLSFQREQHRNFIKYFKDLVNEVREMKESSAYIMFRFQTLVVDWLVNHTCREDRHFGRFIKYGKDKKM